ncbi:hypothetical protein B0H13DRAFT_2310162 [Mycena leptocephala]|nr:hypothetical protein B0H13DRAFT_2310162 [Mycena leptocephala]
MPLMEFYAGSNDHCYRCNKPGDPKLRTCARCHVARYCSPGCQREDWKHHKLNCTDHKTNLKNHPDPTIDEKLKVFLKWLDPWRDALIAWGAFSADLANQPPGYLLTHSYLVEVERVPGQEAPKQARSKFLAILGGMRTDEQMRQEFDRLPDLEYRAQIIENFKRISPAPGKLRVTVVCYPFYSHVGDHIRNVFPDRKTAAFTNPASPESRLVSTALVHAWEERFAEHVRTGNVTGHKQVLENLIQGGQVLVEAALDVD